MSLPVDPNELIQFVQKGFIDTEKQEISNSIRNNVYSISTFVEKLGPALTSKENNVRAQGTLILASIIETLTDILSTEELHVLCIFFVDRLSDHHSVIPACIKGLAALIKSKNLNLTETSRIFKKFFQMVSCQSQSREDRRTIFDLIEVASKHRKRELLSMGPDFIFGVIHAIEGERDPRNLLFLFQFMPEFIKTFPLELLAEEMFEVFACYFPIDFNPSPNDPDAITREVLADNLANCLCACKEFSDGCIELLLDKMSSELNVAKIDSLKLLAKCGETFDNAVIEKHFHSIWDVLQKDLQPQSDKEINGLAANALMSLLKPFTVSTVEKMLSNVISTIIPGLTHLESHNFETAVDISIYCAKSSPIACEIIIGKLFSLFLSQFEANLDSKEEIKLLMAIQRLLVVVKEHNLLEHMDPNLVARAQNKYVNIILHETDLTIVKVAFETLSVLPEIVSTENRYDFYVKLLTYLEKAITTEGATKYIGDALVAFAKLYPEEVRQTVVEKIKDNYDLLLLLFPLIHLQHFLDFITEMTFTTLFDIKLDEAKREYICTKINDFLQKDSTDILNVWYSKGFLDKLSQFNNQHVHQSTDFLNAMSSLTKLIVRSLAPEIQTKIIKIYLPNVNLQETTDLYFTAGLLGYLDQDIVLEDHFEGLATEITKLSASTNDSAIRTVCNHLLCSLFNKMPDNENHKTILAKIISFISDEIKKHNKQAVEILAWLSKALLTRSYTNASEIIETLSELLDHPDLSEAAQLAFEILSIEVPQLHLPLVKHLFKQKLFVLVCKKLERKIETYTKHHLSALTFVLRVTPHQVLIMEINKIGPILFKCLELSEEKPVTCTLEIVQRFLSEKNDYFRLQIQAIIPLLLKLTCFKDKMKIRTLALQSLDAVADYPTFILLPHKSKVLHGLVNALDDKKRLVRKAAAGTRLKWFMVGESNDEN